MNRAVFFTGLLLASPAAWTADFGIGISVQSDDSWIYMPIDFSPRFRIEPSIRFVDSESESSQPGSFSTTNITVRTQSDALEIGLGVFGLAAIADSVRMYYGGRISYIDSKTTQTITTRFANFTDVDSEKSSQDGYRIAPTLGFEYLFSDHFSIGGEAEWYYQKLDADFTLSSGGVARAEADSNGTDTRLIVRFRF